MTESEIGRIVHHETQDGHRHTAFLRRTPETDQLSDDEIITRLEEWRAKHRPADRERWPTPDPFSAWLMTTKPGPREPCTECHTWGLRSATPPNGPGDERVICTNPACEASPFYRDGTP